MILPPQQDALVDLACLISTVGLPEGNRQDKIRAIALGAQLDRLLEGLDGGAPFTGPVERHAERVPVRATLRLSLVSGSPKSRSLRSVGMSEPSRSAGRTR